MRVGTLFLCKTLAWSLGLFLAWPYLSKGYGAVLISLIEAIDPYRHAIHEKWPYIASLFLIPLFSLTLSTPQLRWIRTAIILGSGTAASLVLDLVKIHYGIGDNNNYLVWYSVYHTLKWLVPLLVWVSFCYLILGEIFGGEDGPEAARSMQPCCPLCGVPHQDMVLHIKEEHGEKALRIKKVRRFFAEEERKNTCPGS